MLSVSNGYSTRYLTDEVATGREGYYTGAVAAGEPPGLWFGAGADALGLHGEVDAELMEAVYTHLLDPRDAATHSRSTWGEAAPLAVGHRKYRTAAQIYEQLLDAHPNAGPEERAELRAQAARSARQAVSFVDVTFSVPKSVTVTGAAFERAANDARAAGDLEAAAAWDVHARAVEDAVMAGARAAIEFLQDHGYSRTGHHGGGGGRWIDAQAFVVAQFLQHDSRERDPQWHVHNAILNRVLCSDGVWRALDGRVLREMKAAAGAIAERVTEAHLARSLGVRCETRPDGVAREVVGVDREVMDLYSNRRHQIGPKAQELMTAFEARFGRPPSLYERSMICEQATLATRRAKSHDGETREQQLDRWEAMCRARLAGGLAAVAESVLARAQEPGEPGRWSPVDVIERAVVAVSEERQHYGRSALMRAVSDALPGHLDIDPDDVRPLLEGLADAALDLAVRLTPQSDVDELPDDLRLANGASVFERPGSVRYSTAGQLAAERKLIAAAVERGAVALEAAAAELAEARFAESGVTLGPDQAAAVRGVLTSGAQVEVLLAAAGTGKSFVVGAIADSWTHTDDPTVTQRRVFGLAPYQVAVDVLAGEGLAAKNVPAWLATQNRLDRPRPSGGPNGDDEAWRLRRGDLVVVDEAGTAETGALVEIHRRCQAAGAKLLLVGDPRQLTAIGPGGALADIAEHGITYQLGEVRRFTNDWEGPASLRLRDGDASVLSEYAKQGRLVDAGTAGQAEAAASRAWLADTLRGKESLLLVGTNAAAARVSAALRAELVALGRVAEDGVQLGMRDWEGVTVGVGDLVQARALAWHLRGWEGNTAAPITRQTYRVTALRPDGGLTVAPIVSRAAEGEELGAPMQLPASYVREHLSLGYASTRDAAQGRNVDTSHSVVGAGTDAAGLYVPATRGRECNTIYTVTRHLAPDAETGETHDVAERSAEAVLADVLAAAHEERSAHAEQQHAEAEARSTMTHIDQMVDVIREVTAGRTAATLDRLAAEGAITAHQRAQLAADDAFGSLERLLRTAELAGHDPDAVLTAAVTARSLHDATAPAQVLHHRITTTLTGQLTPRIRTGTADLIPVDVCDDKRGAWLHARAEAADSRRRELGAEIAADAPPWALDALGPVPEDRAAREEWEHRAGWAAAYRELVGHTDSHDPLGPAPGKGRVEHSVLFRAAHEALALIDGGAEEANMSDGQLRARVIGYERELNWAPRYVADELDATRRRLATAEADAVLWTARADAPDTAAVDAEQLRAAAATARAEAEQLARLVADLEVIDEARARWYTETAVSRDLAERSRAELRARGVDPDCTDDLVTAAEWLDAERTARAEDDAHRDIDEQHLHDAIPELDHRALDAGPRAEPAPDVRESGVPDPAEARDPVARRRILALDEVSDAVARAQDALREIASRRTADEAHATQAAAQRAITEDVLLGELQRQSPVDEVLRHADESECGLDRLG